jgi:hypothetical protein
MAHKGRALMADSAFLRAQAPHRPRLLIPLTQEAAQPVTVNGITYTVSAR